MKYIIMCGCNPDDEHPKHMIKVDGEEIVERSIRLLRNNGVEDIAISSQNKRFEKYGVPVLVHDNKFYRGGYWVDTFYPIDEPACYIFGDVYFSEGAMYIIATTKTDDVAFFASSPPFGKGYPKPWAEPFAFKVCNQKHFRESIEKVKEMDKRHKFMRHPISWELWQVIKGTQPNVIDFHNYCEINDYTCDVDSEDEVNQWRVRK